MAGRVPALGFDLGTVLDKLKGKTARKYRNQQSVYAQGDAADAVFFIRSGKVKLTVASPRGRKAMIGLLEQGASSAKVAWRARLSACPARPPFSPRESFA